jgi:hypothetical protein
LDELAQADKTIQTSEDKERKGRHTRVKLVATGVVVFASLPLFLLIGTLLNLSSTGFQILKVGDFFQYAAVFLTLFLGLITLVWKYDSIIQ